MRCHPLLLLFLLAPGCGDKEVDDDDAGGEEESGGEGGGSEEGGEEGGDEGGEGQLTVCGDEVCGVHQYCFIFVSGVNPDSGSAESDPSCVDAPGECGGIATCDCIQAAAECTECTETDGIRCTSHGA